PRAEAALAEIAQLHDVETAARQSDPRRLERARQVARVRGVERDIAERVAETARLLVSEVGERTVGLPDPAVVAGPVGLAAPRDERGGHRRGLRFFADAAYVQRTVVVIPPRAVNSPATVMRRGRSAATSVSRISFVAAS